MSHSLSFNPEHWVHKYSDALYSFTLPRVQDQSTAEDIVQETFLSAWRSRETYQGQASEKNWLYAICKNKIIDHYRKKARTPIDIVDTAESFYFDDANHWDANTAPKEWGIDYNLPVEKKEFYSILNLCRNKLKNLQQAVFNMKYMEDLESDEICKELNITPSNYWVLMHRAKLQLRTCLEKNWINL